MDSKDVMDFFMGIGVQNLKGKVIGLIGDLGAGKTHLVKELSGLLCKGLKGIVSSPTYNLCHVYKSPELEIHHFDLYRIENEDDLYNIGLWDSIESGNSLLFIEWINLHTTLIDVCDYIISIALKENNERVFSIDSPMEQISNKLI